MRSFLALALLSGTAAANPALDEHGYLTVDGASTLSSGELSFGLGSLDWTHARATSVDVTTATLGAAVGLPYHVELAATQPLSVVSGNGANAMGAFGGSGGQGTGDLGLHAKLGIIPHVAVIGRVYLPTATGIEMTPDALATELDVATGARMGRLRVDLDAGMRWQSGTHTPVVGGGAAIAVTPSFEVVGELTGTVGLATAPTNLAALGGIKLYLAKNSYLTLGAGRGIETGDTRAVIGIVFEPRPIARPLPEPPPAEEIVEHHHEEPPPPPPDVPDLDLAQIVESKIEILEPIQFEFDKATILPASFHVLDAVVATMTNNPSIGKVEVGGHTDERGGDAYNLDLSQRRAEAVVDYLVAHGIAPERLNAQGYGLTRPVDPAHTEDAWAKNRRVEFVIQGR